MATLRRLVAQPSNPSHMPSRNMRRPIKPLLRELGKCLGWLVARHPLAANQLGCLPVASVRMPIATNGASHP